jgi:hypothetical protein
MPRGHPPQACVCARVLSLEHPLPQTPASRCTHAAHAAQTLHQRCKRQGLRTSVREEKAGLSDTSLARSRLRADPSSARSPRAGGYTAIMTEVKQEMVPIQVLIPKGLRRRLNVVAAHEEKPVADILREFIEWYVSSKEDK